MNPEGKYDDWRLIALGVALFLLFLIAAHLN
jgi:hypothetical protein